MDNRGITISCGYGYYHAQIGDDILRCHSDMDIEYLELTGGMRINSDEYKNKAETEVMTNEKAIELAKNEVTTEYDRIFVGYDDENSTWEIIFWADEKISGGPYVFIDSKGITQAVIERPFVLARYDNAYKKYIELLEKRGGIVKYSDEFKNKTKIQINYENRREKAIELAKNELTPGYEYGRIIVYYDELKGRFMVSFWSDDTLTKGEHIFIKDNGITDLVIYTE